MELYVSMLKRVALRLILPITLKDDSIIGPWNMDKAANMIMHGIKKRKKKKRKSAVLVVIHH